ncbi:MAG: hypothetical protein HUJ56_05885, partial [Erysipelotrichaceae bacterium]|nr:hypothetical protein [Erysipelotrichaceae bacterium]
AIGMIEHGKVDMIHEDKLFALQQKIVEFLEMIQMEYSSYEAYLNKKERLLGALKSKVTSVFH